MTWTISTSSSGPVFRMPALYVPQSPVCSLLFPQAQHGNVSWHFSRIYSILHCFLSMHQAASSVFFPSLSAILSSLCLNIHHPKRPPLLQHQHLPLSSYPFPLSFSSPLNCPSHPRPRRETDFPNTSLPLLQAYHSSGRKCPAPHKLTHAPIHPSNSLTNSIPPDQNRHARRSRHSRLFIRRSAFSV